MKLANPDGFGPEYRKIWWKTERGQLSRQRHYLKRSIRKLEAFVCKLNQRIDFCKQVLSDLDDKWNAPRRKRVVARNYQGKFTLPDVDD